MAGIWERTNGPNEAQAQTLIDLLDRYGWSNDLDLLERMSDPHWRVVADLETIHSGVYFPLPSMETRRVVVERIRSRPGHARSAAA